MKKYFIFIGIALLIIPLVLATSVKQQAYDTESDGTNTINDLGAYWHGQTFTPAANYNLTNATLYLIKVGSPTGSATVSLRATSGGKPTGSDIAVASVSVGSIPTSLTWIDFSFNETYEVQASTLYAIVYRHIAGNSTNNIGWRRDLTSASFSGGQEVISSNSGGTWTTSGYTTYDFLFKLWTTTPVISDSCTYSGTGNWVITNNCNITTSVNLATGATMFVTTGKTVKFNSGGLLT